MEAGLKLEVKPWDFLTSVAKDAARGWFVKRAEDRGIQWGELVSTMEAAQPQLTRLHDEVRDLSVSYPDYYLKPFHGYDAGNLEWRAAHELEPATQSMCLGYYEGVEWQEAQEMFRGKARNTMAEWWRIARGGAEAASAPPPPRALLDMGCSGGFSTNEMARAFPGCSVTGLDLSPHYLAVAQQKYPDLAFKHGLAEDTGFPDASLDVVTLNFLLHELPLSASRAVLKEACRVLAPGGMIAVLDVDPLRLLELPPYRRWAFQVTEPWCKDGEYYALDICEELTKLGFKDAERLKNDPVNQLVLAAKK